jgi:hypothetical protein
MPDGLIMWVDPVAGKAEIKGRRGRYVARIDEIEPPARRVGARVHFDVRREGGVESAVDVQLRPGMRSSRHHRGFGTLVGARRPDTKGPAPFALPHPEYGLALAGHPLDVAGRWARFVAAGELDQAIQLYEPDAVLHIGGVGLRGCRHIRARLEVLSVFASGHLPTVRGEDGLVLARWDPPDVSGAAVDAHCRVEHGLIAEQWITPPGPELVRSVLETTSGKIVLTTSTQGDVSSDAIDYARQRIGHLATRIDEPISFARIKLSVAADPARSRPAMAQASLEINGRPVRAQVAAHEMHEAVDLLQRRLADQIAHRAQHLESLRRHSPDQAEPGEWRRGDLPSVRPDYFDRSVDQRQLVRHKPFVAAEENLDEAIFEMDQLDYDFHLFRDIDSREDSLLYRLPNGACCLQHLHPSGSPPSISASDVVLDARPAPTLTLDGAIEHLNLSGLRYVFFADPMTGRGNVVYRRYDGHYGLLTLEQKPGS